MKFANTYRCRCILHEWLFIVARKRLAPFTWDWMLDHASPFSLSIFSPLHSSDWLPYLHPSKRRRRAKESHLYMICWASDPHFWLFSLSLLDGKWSGFLYTLSRKEQMGIIFFYSSGIHLFIVIKNWITRRLAERIRRAVAAAQEAALWHPERNSLA